jgi:Response regulator of the LytR/AlgR family
MRTLIIDDSKNDLDLIRQSFVALTSIPSITSHCDTSTTIPENIDALRYDLYILDIDMPEMNGFEVAKKINSAEPDAFIMFCSNHDELVFDSFRLNTFYFIRKSNLRDDMTEALHKFISTYDKENTDFIIQQGSSVQKIPYTQIVYFEVTGNDLFVKTENREYRIRKTLKSLMESVPKHDFIQPAKNYLLNIKYVSEISKNIIILKNGEKFKISRLYVDSAKKQYLDYMVK